MDSKKKGKKVVSESYLHQINVLKSLSDGVTFQVTTPPLPLNARGGQHPSLNAASNKLFEISEIANRSGLRDEKEVLRYLYILEGQKLVTPQPVGDFTSKTWCITQDGVRALKSIDSSMVQ